MRHFFLERIFFSRTRMLLPPAAININTGGKKDRELWTVFLIHNLSFEQFGCKIVSAAKTRAALVQQRHNYEIYKNESLTYALQKLLQTITKVLQPVKFTFKRFN